MLSVDKILLVNNALFNNVSLYEQYAVSFAVIDDAYDPFRECPRVRSAKGPRYGAKSAKGSFFSSGLIGVSSVGWIGKFGDFSPSSVVDPMSGPSPLSRLT